MTMKFIISVKQHMLSSCKSYLNEGRYTLRQNSVLLFLANTFSSFKKCTAYAHLPSFPSPFSLLVILFVLIFFHIENKTIYILELKIGFETNIKSNSNRKADFIPICKTILFFRRTIPSAAFFT